MTEINEGEIYASPTDNGYVEPIRVTLIDQVSRVLVTDPTEHHAQSSRSGTWKMEYTELRDAVEVGDLVEVEMKLVPKDE